MSYRCVVALIAWRAIVDLVDDQAAVSIHRGPTGPVGIRAFPAFYEPDNLSFGRAEMIGHDELLPSAWVAGLQAVGRDRLNNQEPGSHQPGVRQTQNHFAPHDSQSQILFLL